MHYDIQLVKINNFNLLIIERDILNGRSFKEVYYKLKLK